MSIYQSKYLLAIFNKESSLMRLSWNTSSEELNADGVKFEMDAILKHIEKHRPLKVIADTTDFNYSVNQDMQNWIVNYFLNKVILLGGERYAIMVSSEILDEVSTEQINSDEEEDVLIKYFDDDDKAMNWVNEI